MNVAGIVDPFVQPEPTVMLVCALAPDEPGRAERLAQELADLVMIHGHRTIVTRSVTGLDMTVDYSGATP